MQEKQIKNPREVFVVFNSRGRVLINSLAGFERIKARDVNAVELFRGDRNSAVAFMDELLDGHEVANPREKFLIVDANGKEIARGTDFDKLQTRVDRHNENSNTRWFVVAAKDMKRNPNDEPAPAGMLNALYRGYRNAVYEMASKKGLRITNVDIDLQKKKAIARDASGYFYEIRLTPKGVSKIWKAAKNPTHKRNISPELQDAIDREKERTDENAKKIEAISAAANPDIDWENLFKQWLKAVNKRDHTNISWARGRKLFWSSFIRTPLPVIYQVIEEYGSTRRNTTRNASGELYNAHKLDELSGMFQGEISGEQIQTVGSDYTPSALARLGQLTLLKIKNGGDLYEIAFKGDSWLSMDARKNLYIDGKSAKIRNAKKPRAGSLLHLGTLEQFNYITAKRHIENGEVVEYFHEVGEVDGVKPNVFIDHDGFPLIIGGNYDIGIHGVEN